MANFLSDIDTYIDMERVDKQKEKDVRDQLGAFEEIANPVISSAIVRLKFEENWNVPCDEV